MSEAKPFLEHSEQEAEQSDGEMQAPASVDRRPSTMYLITVFDLAVVYPSKGHAVCAAVHEFAPAAVRFSDWDG